MTVLSNTTTLNAIVDTIHPDEPHKFPELDIFVTGLGVEYPPHELSPDNLKEFALKHNPPTPALQKVLAVAYHTGIDKRATFSSVDSPLLSQPNPPPIDQLSTAFLQEGVKLSVAACRKAVAEWGGDLSEITHLVSVTCTHTGNPGFDFYVARHLGLRANVQRTLLHGVGCAGGMSALRQAAELAVASTFMGKPARILVLACELTSLLSRVELEAITKTQEVLIAATLFGDCASAILLSNGIGVTGKQRQNAIYRVLGWDSLAIPNTDKELGMDVCPNGYRTILSPKVPALSASATGPLFTSLVARVPHIKATEPNEFDWALHPGGLKVILGVQKAMGLTAEHLRASYDVYKNHGNTSSATVFSVLNRLRQPDMQARDRGRKNVVAAAFGPGIMVEMAMLKLCTQYPGDNTTN